MASALRPLTPPPLRPLLPLANQADANRPSSLPDPLPRIRAPSLRRHPCGQGPAASTGPLQKRPASRRSRDLPADPPPIPSRKLCVTRPTTGAETAHRGRRAPLARASPTRTADTDSAAPCAPPPTHPPPPAARNTRACQLKRSIPISLNQSFTVGVGCVSRSCCCAARSATCSRHALAIKGNMNANARLQRLLVCPSCKNHSPSHASP